MVYDKSILNTPVEFSGYEKAGEEKKVYITYYEKTAEHNDLRGTDFGKYSQYIEEQLFIANLQNYSFPDIAQACGRARGIKEYQVGKITIFGTDKSVLQTGTGVSAKLKEYNEQIEDLRIYITSLRDSESERSALYNYYDKLLKNISTQDSLNAGWVNKALSKIGAYKQF